MIPLKINPQSIQFLLRLVLGGLFLYSGGAKLLDPAVFQIEILNFELVSRSLAGLVALYLPWLEILCGAALIAKRPLGGSLLILGGLMIFFILLVSFSWARGLDVTCGCFGVSDADTNYPLWIARNFIILGGLGAIGWLEWMSGKA